LEVLPFCFAIAFGSYADVILPLILWAIAGFAQTLAEMPSQILIAEKIDKREHGKVYGAHFAWSHLWWAFAYPIAGYTGAHFRQQEFLIGAGISFVLFILVIVFFYPKKQAENL
jgi:MFS transporter, NRE family, putaive nickel resistance protein